MDRTGNKVGQYTITKEIGRGAFADVYEVKNNKKEKLALKMIAKNRSIYFESSNASKEVLAEIRVLAEIDHKFVLNFVEGFKDTEKGRWCIVTELCDGDLRERINEKIESKGIFPQDVILDWFAMITMALEYIHHKNLLHRDLKPENILCNDNSIVKLSDFGFSKFLENAAQGTVCGTPAYMAPEVDKKIPYNTLCDIWSLGVLVHELCWLHPDIEITSQKIPSEYSIDLQAAILCMLKETPQHRLSASKLLQLAILKDRVAKFETGIKATISAGNSLTFSREPFKTESGYSTASSSKSATASRNPEKAFSFLDGVNPDTVSLIETGKEVIDMVHSQSSGLIYVVAGSFISGFKWDGKNNTFNRQFQISFRDTTESDIYSITLAPQDSSGGDQIFISVGSKGKSTKNVHRLSGKELEKRVLLVDTSYIDDECYMWLLASNIDRHILLIHPDRTSFIYVYVKEQKHGKVDFNRLSYFKHEYSERIELLGQLLILGDLVRSKVYLCELIVTKSDAFINSGCERKQIASRWGHFAALSHIQDGEDEKLHLFTCRKDRDNDCTEILEYKFNLSVSGSDLKPLPMQPIHTLKVKGKFNPRYLVNVDCYSSILIGQKSKLMDARLSAVELTKQHVVHRIERGNIQKQTKTAANSECVIL